ncbi:hypothetical protein R5R35_013680 [Gryllus longicercus]|uniref:Intimal thickness related receptor IRP domain-containing protein n=1 Tax=Gryllus longicercus TaxID=2509291 RepID=A0AAN9Z518_9ORTH
MFKNIINVWFTVVITLFLPLKESVILEGELYSKENWAFIARFCFLPNIGKLAYTIEYDEKKYATQYLLLYYDTPEQWASAYKPGLGCKQKEDFSNITNRIALHPNNTITCRIIKKYGKRDTVSCSDQTTFLLARRRWWYIAASHCNSSVGIYLKFKLRMTNGNEGDFWHEHFSADELYILPILMSFFVAYVFLLVAVGFCTVELKSRKMYHATYKLFVASVVLQETGISIQTIVYIKHALNGRGISKIRTLGRLLEAISETIFLLLLLLLAKGFTVTRGRLRLASTVKLTVFMCLYTVSYLVIFIYERLFFDPGKVLYLYESPPGYGLIILRILAWWIFVYSIVFTLKHYPEKAVFYYPFNILGTLWFVSGPTFILITNSFIDKWVRESVVCGVLHFITLCGHLQFLFLTLPTTANKVFPYQVRTSQVAAMQDADPDGTLPFSHHVYAPSAPLPPTLIPAPDRPELGPQPLQADWTTNVPVELFCISRTVDSRTETIIPLKPLGSNTVGIGNHIRTSSLSSEENESVTGRTRSNGTMNSQPL